MLNILINEGCKNMMMFMENIGIELRRVKKKHFEYTHILYINIFS